MNKALKINIDVSESSAPHVEQKPSFVQNTASKLGMNRRTIERAVRRSEMIDQEVKEAIREVPEIAAKVYWTEAPARRTGRTRSAFPWLDILYHQTNVGALWRYL
ncbi:MAG: hypothetical protein HQL97_09130 [Magnetococcales bacterium]|nr:hypothetical protein [Magnetococcales bacterium]